MSGTSSASITKDGCKYIYKRDGAQEDLRVEGVPPSDYNQNAMLIELRQLAASQPVDGKFCSASKNDGNGNNFEYKEEGGQTIFTLNGQNVMNDPTHGAVLNELRNSAHSAQD